MRIDTKYIKGRNLITLFRILTVVSSVPNHVAKEHFEENRLKWEEYKNLNNIEYIEKQNQLDILSYGRYRKIWNKYISGNRKITAAFNSCEVIGTYNALVNLKDFEKGSSFPELLQYFEQNATVLNGYFGTSFYSVKKFFEKRGYECKMIVGNKINAERIKEIQDDYSVYLMYSYNNEAEIRDAIHTVCVTKVSDGYQLHNASQFPFIFPSLSEAIYGYNTYNGNKSRPVAVLGVRKCEK